MKISVLNLLLGKAEIPEGFPVALAAQFVPDVNGPLTNTKFYFQVQIDSDYYFLLERIGASYPFFGNVFGSGNNAPRVEVLRDKGTRPYQESPIELRLIATPGETPGPAQLPQNVNQLKSAIGPQSFWEPGSVLKMVLDNFAIDSSGETAQRIELIAFGRYIFREDYRTKGGALK